MRMQVQYERRYRRKTDPIFEKQRSDALNALVAHASSLHKDFTLFNDSEYDQTMLKSLTPLITDLATVQGGLALAFAGAPEGDEFLMTAPFKQLLQDGTQKMAQNVNDNTLEMLNATLAQGMSQGEALGKLEDRVNAVFDRLTGYQSERIARTETLKASNAATAWAYKQTGYVVGKQWYVNPDSCDICAEMDGKTVPVDDSFLDVGDQVLYGDDKSYAISYDTVEEPPLHPQCRCTIIPTTDLGDDPTVIGDSGDEDIPGDTVYRGEGDNVGGSGANMFGNAYYVARDAETASNFGTVHQLQMPLTAKDVLIIHSQYEYQSFVDDAIAWKREQGSVSSDPNVYLPAYIRHLGYKAAEASAEFDPLGGVGIVDPKAIEHMRSQIK